MSGDLGKVEKGKVGGGEVGEGNGLGGGGKDVRGNGREEKM